MAYAKQQRKKGTLTKDEIVQCAFNLIANKGTEGCSMRALGNELGVSAMSGFASSALSIVMPNSSPTILHKRSPTL